MKLRNVNMLKCEKKATFVVPLSVNPMLAFVKLSRKTENVTSFARLSTKKS